jgi:hypothetical protein
MVASHEPFSIRDLVKTVCSRPTSDMIWKVFQSTTSHSTSFLPILMSSKVMLYLWISVVNFISLIINFEFSMARPGQRPNKYWNPTTKINATCQKSFNVRLNNKLLYRVIKKSLCSRKKQTLCFYFMNAHTISRSKGVGCLLTVNVGNELLNTSELFSAWN